ncbi:uncharacterized protein FFB20_05690 [Fusarium fujikuroi]|uniref:Secreted protein n=1 Tax=Gibberella fujikuroi (strain CBS 195.34 / IMI 58289 / NRRL A-6831) TaxID=1279085 RepID=S0EAZ6_GIBF5|nr:uncharacterized protein FFUJ_13965 [Fusarium fujikuroi IMI 58289]KLO99656.1 uncharacterized protein Y057_7314 [Fusarium fujikuroi]KLP01285.1 uncharacterized protein LW94_8042 [Fusarium fujikuroi]CCT72039.1 uncharacterized protein FFUJ_13965 [Fusarium fujikuroi IMI 58289]SCN78232.1 uncharacterized protein FFB20_05690 [Fusarium fujikuroi]SCO10961.1 uncharacterized protein FFC1_11296 [Fusarium fujikuroi]
MHIPSVLFSTLILSTASAFPTKTSNPERLFPRLLLRKLDTNADEHSLRFQPALDLDRDSCYHTAAIDRDGTVDKGLSELDGLLAKDCRDKSRLDNANVYTRKRCNNGWWAYMYDYYFEAHRTGSVHGKYHHRDNPLLQDGHPLIVYYKRPMTTDGLRFAKYKDVKNVKNRYWKWVIVDLVGWDRFPTPKFRHKLLKYNYGKARFHLADKHFSKGLHKAAGKHVPEFNPKKDGREEYDHNREKINIKKGKKDEDKLKDNEVKSVQGEQKEEEKGEENE